MIRPRFMRSLSQLVTLLLVLIGVGAMRPARAEGTFIPAASRVDFTHDAYRNIIYIANGTQILRYSLNTDAFLTPFVLPRNAGQLDISPDGQALAVATRPSTNNTAIQSTTFTLINLQTGEIRTPSIYADGDYGIVSLAFDNAGQIFVVPFSSSGNAGSMRRYNLATDTSAWPGNRYISRPLLKASPERDIIGIAERSSSGGQWAYFDLPNGQFLFPPNNISNGTGQFNYAIGLTGNGAQFALPTYGGVSIYNKAGTLLTKLGQYPGVTGMGLAYHPTQPVMYIPWAGTSEMRVFDTNSFAQIGSYNFETLFDSQGTASFAKGHTRVSDDGTVLMASVDNGVRFLRLSAPTTPPLRALGSTVAVNEDSSLTVQLKAAGGLPTHGPSYEVVVAPKNGTLSAPITSQLQTYTPNPNFNGTDQFQFRATQNGQSSLAWVYITVNPVNDAPVATAPANPSRVRSGGSVRMPYGTATDIDSTSLRWRIVRAPQHGTAEEDFGGGAFIYRASADFVGVDTFDAVVNDGTTAWGNTPATPGLDSNVVTYTVNVIRNAAPVAVNDTYYNVPRYGVYQVPAPGVLANDYDPDGDAITASSVEYVSWGYAWISPDGTLNWEPWYTSHLWDSTITITYYVRDELGYGNKAVVTLSIGQRATANAQSVSTPEDTAKSITLTGGGEPGLIYSIVSQPANGTVTGVLPNVVYTPNSNWNGSDEFTFAVDASNGTRAIAKVTVDVTPANDAPTAAAVAASGTEDTELPIVLSGTDIDRDTLTYTLVSNPAHGTLSGTGDSRTYTPAPNYHGPDSFTYKVNDGTVDSATATVSITIEPVNDVLTAVNDSARTPKNVPVTIAVKDNDKDDDGVAFTVVSATQGANGSVTIVDGTSALYTPRRNFIGTDTFVYAISNGQGETATATVTVTVESGTTGGGGGGKGGGGKK